MAEKQQSVSPQVTDAVTQSNVSVVAQAPAMAIGNVYQTLAHATGMLFENSTASQQQQDILSQAATTQGVMQIYSLDMVAEKFAKPTKAKGS